MKIIKKPTDTSVQIDNLRQQIAQQQILIEYLIKKMGDKDKVNIIDEEQE